MGASLTKTVIEKTGLPPEMIEKEFNTILAKFGKNPESLTVEELREVMAEYLQLVFLELQEELSA
ncbi:MAG: hypothetical protein ACXVCY_06860 [Pseudobdellovibrionaceae bacterium]